MQRQLQQVHNFNRQMKEHFENQAQRCLDKVVAEAAKREAQLVANMKAGTIEPLFNKQLEQALIAVEKAQQEVENWKGNSTFWEDIATQAEENVQELTEKLAALGGRSGAETRTFSERCASQQKETSASRGLRKVFF